MSQKIVIINPSPLSGNIHAAASKSSMQRACAAALVARGKSIIYNPGNSNDDQAAMDIIKRLGAQLSYNNTALVIDSDGVNPVNAEIDCGESGLSIRMFTPLVAMSSKQITITGSGSLQTRPMDFFDSVFPQLSVQVNSNQGKLPLKVQGPIRPVDIEIDGSLSSQFLTGLLLAFAASDAQDVSIKVKNLKSKPYIDLTLNVMEAFGLKLPENRNYETFHFSATAHRPTNSERSYTVEGDWSGAAFLLVAGATAGPISVLGLDVFSTQADKAIVQALIDCGCSLSIQSDRIEIGPASLKPFHFNATECPDLFPPLVALAAQCNGKSVIEGTSRLTHKESNRALTLQDEFSKLGIRIDLQDDLMIVHGGTGIKNGKVHSRHDHRIAMACAVAALQADGQVQIEEADAINKSYPDFYRHLSQLGALVTYPQSVINHK